MKHLITILLLLSSLASYGQGPISGVTSLCTGSTTSLTDATAGGTWSSSNAGVAAVGSSTGLVTGISAGTATITYTVGAGDATATVTVNPLPGSITGSLAVCSGATSSLSDATGGGTWSSSSIVVGTIGATGVLTGIMPGTTVITYTLPTGCFMSAVATVNPLPGPINGNLAPCLGTSASLSDAAPGGAWSSSNPVVATINPGTGVVTTVSTGTTLISYVLATGCSTISALTVNITPALISGNPVICSATPSVLSDATPGGTWSSSNTAVATISLGGVVTGVSPGTSIISYTLPSSCSSILGVTVNVSPGSITGSVGICTGTSTSLTDGTPGGVWSSSNTAVGTVSATGVVTGVGIGSTTISYALGSCYTTAAVTVNATPVPISGSMSICPGSTSTLSDVTPGGVWSSSNIAIATISTAGVVTGASVGSATISYTIGSCYTTSIITVNPSPVAITGSTNVCSGASTTLSNATAGGAWSCSNPAIATISLIGVVTGISPGTATIFYTLPTGCSSSSGITVNPVPATITGSTTICPGASTTLSDITAGGIWSSSSPTIEMIGLSTGIVTGISPGTAVISYSLPTGCFTTAAVTVNVSPAPITGPGSVCTGSIISLTDTSSGGTWTSSNISVATISSPGIVSGIAANTATISYTLPSGCYATFIVTVNTVAPVTGTSIICVTTTAVLSDIIPGGTWSSSNIAVASVGSSGTVTGVSPGVAVITYSSGGCFAFANLTVDPTPAPVTGGNFVCTGQTLTLDDTDAGGTWSSSNSGIATISFIGGSSGVVTGISSGTVVMTYSLGAGCYATTVITVNSSPVITASATRTACGGLYLATASGGTTYSWSPSTGVGCATCATTYIDPSAATYLVTGILDGCPGSAILPVNDNRIHGHISFSGPAPASLNMKVWLVQYNPTDSSLITLDSMLTCVDSSLPYYEFDSLPAGNYFVKAELLSSVPGITGYVPTYGSGIPYWDSAQSIIHTSTSDSLHITMMYGIVTPGSGNIRGHIVMQSGSSTVPVPSLPVYLLDNSNNMVTYTYTDGSGAYSFGGLAHGGYIVYPENYDYYTTPSGVTLSYASDTNIHTDFIQNNSVRTITPYTGLGVFSLSPGKDFTIYPNPASVDMNITWINQPPCDADMTVTDMLGREVYRSSLKIKTATGEATINIKGWQKGVYIISARSATINFSEKLLIVE